MIHSRCSRVTRGIVCLTHEGGRQRAVLINEWNCRVVMRVAFMTCAVSFNQCESDSWQYSANCSNISFDPVKLPASKCCLLTQSSLKLEYREQSSGYFANTIALNHTALRSSLTQSSKLMSPMAGITHFSIVLPRVSWPEIHRSRERLCHCIEESRLKDSPWTGEAIDLSFH
jgi:hypothetical protein